MAEGFAVDSVRVDWKTVPVEWVPQPDAQDQEWRKLVSQHPELQIERVDHLLCRMTLPEGWRFEVALACGSSRTTNIVDANGNLRVQSTFICSRCRYEGKTKVL